MKGYRTSIPEEAQDLNGFMDERTGKYIRTKEQIPNGALDCVLNDEIIGFRYREDNGCVTWEYQIKDGKTHGYYRYWDQDGLLSYETHYVDGLEHGTGRQWNWHGRLTCKYEIEHGQGTDLWCDQNGVLAESNVTDGDLWFRRIWNGDDKTVIEEFLLKSGARHGIWREWNAKGRLRRGFPQYHVNGKKVAKRQYLKACETDPTLPPFRLEDNDPHRKLPKEFKRRVIYPDTCPQCGEELWASEICPECNTPIEVKELRPG